MALCDVTSNSVHNLRFNDKSTNVMNSPSLTENYMNAPCLRTYLRTNKSLLKKSSYTKTSLTKKVPNDTSTCSKFFFRGRNPKNDRDRAKKPSFLTKNCGLSVFS